MAGWGRIVRVLVLGVCRIETMTGGKGFPRRAQFMFHLRDGAGIPMRSLAE